MEVKIYPRFASLGRSNRVGSAAKKKEKQTTDVVCFSLAAEPGFEPRMTESEAGVLPLHYSARLL